MAVNLFNQKTETNMSKNKYNFKNPEVKKKVAFRLFIVYKKESIYFKKLGTTRGGKITYRGRFNKADKGRGRLMSIFLERMEDIKYAKLYNDITGKEHQSRKKITQVLKTEKD